jgi:hypothetical protein
MSEAIQVEPDEADVTRLAIEQRDAARAERDQYRDALVAIRTVLLRDRDHLAARRAALAIADSLGLPS